MRKINLLLTLLVMVTFMLSCSKDSSDDLSVSLKASTVSDPVSDGGITPKIIDGANRGGNRTCAEVAVAWGKPSNYFLDCECSQKLDYGDFDFNGTFEFSGEFPEWLDVEVTDGKYVSFTVNNTGEACYKVGAVIVKGSNDANVYFYSGGTLGDAGLAAPLNKQGQPAGLSNITFCFVDCQPIVLALKSRYNSDPESTVPESYVVSNTDEKPFVADNWCKKLGIVNYPDQTAFPVMDWYSNMNIGMATIVPMGLNLMVTVTFNEGIYPIRQESYLYAGSLNNLTEVADCPAYTGWAKPVSVGDNVATFIVPF
ncbi:MAG: hypothetical protein WAW07_13285 [Bacteroidales bacterium]